jgi:hypothetical protein
MLMVVGPAGMPIVADSQWLSECVPRMLAQHGPAPHGSNFLDTKIFAGSIRADAARGPRSEGVLAPGAPTPSRCYSRRESAVLTGMLGHNRGSRHDVQPGRLAVEAGCAWTYAAAWPERAGDSGIRARRGAGRGGHGSAPRNALPLGLPVAAA